MGEGRYETVCMLCHSISHRKEPEAMYLLGLAHKKACDNHDPFFCYHAAVHWLSEAHAQGNLKATYELGDYYFSRDDYKSARTYFMHLIEAPPYQTNHEIVALQAEAISRLETFHYHNGSEVEQKKLCNSQKSDEQRTVPATDFIERHGNSINDNEKEIAYERLVSQEEQGFNLINHSSVAPENTSKLYSTPIAHSYSQGIGRHTKFPHETLFKNAQIIANHGFELKLCTLV